MQNPLYAPVPDEDEEAPAPSSGAYVGLAFAVIFEAIAVVSLLAGVSVYHFLRGWLAGR